MNLASRIMSHGALIGVVVLLLAGCGLIPQRATAIGQLAGEWVFVDPEGVTSTLIIDESGRYTVDRAPEEAFRVVVGGAGFFDWDHKVDWDRAKPALGEAGIGQLGRVYFGSIDPEWGASLAYQDPFRRSLQFVIGNPDNQDLIRYVRVDER